MKHSLARVACVAALLATASASVGWSKLMTDGFDRPSVVVVQRPWPPLVDVWVQVPVGALADPVGEEGLSHVSWQTAIQAGGDRDRKQFAAALDALGATLDVDVAARDTIVHGQVPSGELAAFMALLADVVLRPRLKAKEFERQRALAVADAGALVDDDGALATEAARRFLHRKAPLGRALEGTLQSLPRLALKDVRRLHKRAIANPFRFGFAGAVSRQDAVALVRRYFPQRKMIKPLRNRASPAPTLSGRRLLILDRKGRSQAQVVVAVPTLGAASRHMPAMLLAATALGGTYTSRLVRQVRELRGWSYSLDTSLSVSADRGVLQVQWAPGNRVAAASVDLVMGQLELLKSSSVTKKELAFVKDHLRGAHRLAVETAAGELAERMRALALGLPVDYPQRLSSMLARIERKHVTKALAKHFDPSRAVAVVVGDAEVLRPALEKMASGFSIEVIAHDAAPEATTVAGKPTKRTAFARTPRPGPDTDIEYGPLFDSDGNPIDPTSLPVGETGTDDGAGDKDEPSQPPPADTDRAIGADSANG